jgi:hypothetical protein
MRPGHGSPTRWGLQPKWLGRSERRQLDLPSDPLMLFANGFWRNGLAVINLPRTALAA